MTMASLLAAGAPQLGPGEFYRVQSNADGFVFVQIRKDQCPSWRNLWRSSRLLQESRTYRNDDPVQDIVNAAQTAYEALTRIDPHRTYWDGIRALEGDHR